MKKLLLVDDDPDFLESLTLVFEGKYEVFAARNGQQALACLERQRVDAIVLDIRMPVMDGTAFLRELTLQGTKVPVIVASAYELPALDWARSHVTRCLQKPFSITVIGAAIQDVLQP